MPALLRPLRLMAMAALLIACAAKSGVALDPQKEISQYVHNVWQIEQGLPLNSVRAITQTHDGYLWLTTGEGLVRFDGVKFTVFNKQNTHQIPLNQFYPLYEDRVGNLWAGSSGGGLYSYRDGLFAGYQARSGLSENFILAIEGDSLGNLWIGTQGGGLNKLQNGKFTSYTTKEGLPANRVNALASSRSGGLWIGTPSGLTLYESGTFVTYTTNDGLVSNEVLSLFEDNQGHLWIGTSHGLSERAGGRFINYTTAGGLSADDVNAILEDRAGNLWIGTGNGLDRLKNGTFEAYTESSGLSNGTVMALYEDREGSLWVGTRGGGLNRFKEGAFTAFTTQQGLSADFVWCVTEDPDGGLWIGTERGGLNRFKNSKFLAYNTNDGLSNNSVSSLFAGSNSTLWVGTLGGGVNRFRDGKFSSFSTADGLLDPSVRALFEDHLGNVWIGTQTGLNLLRDGKISAFTAREGLPFYYIISITEDSGGSLWIGTHGGGLIRYRDGSFAAFTSKQGLAGDVVSSVYDDRMGNLWIATRNGLSRFRNGKFTNYSTRDGLFDDTIFQILEDGRGFLWMSSNKGIFRILKQDLDRLDQHLIPFVTSFAYGRDDGLKSSECNAGKPGGWKTRDGKLWFATMKGVVMVDPLRLPANPIAPQVRVEEASADRKILEDSAIVNPGAEKFEFHYTATSLLAPEKVQFKYQLEGYDRTWVEAGARRVAFYTHIPPGQYRFRVMACNNDGVWNQEGASFGFQLQPFFYQTPWFYGLSAGALVLLALAGHRLRVIQVQRSFSVVLAERTRIARELHDTLAQSIAGIVLQLDAAEEVAEPERSRHHVRARDLARESLTEARNVVWELRPDSGTAGDFVQVISDHAKKLAGDSSVNVQVQVQVHGDASRLPAAVRQQLLRIGQEAVTNAVKHANARSIEVDLSIDSRSAQLRIHDDGCGFDAAAAPRNGHFGLTGMRERVVQIGGRFDLRTKSGEGTEVLVSVPLEGKQL